MKMQSSVKQMAKSTLNTKHSHHHKASKKRTNKQTNRLRENEKE